MSALFLDGFVKGLGWMLLAGQKLGDPAATISHNHDGIRDIYVTQVYADYATISVLPLGIDIEQGRARLLDGNDVKLAKLLHRLEAGQSVELMLRPDRAPAPQRVRYRFETKAM